VEWSVAEREGFEPSKSY